MIWNVNEIPIYDGIAADSTADYGEIVPAEWIEQLHTLSKYRTIVVRINSGGGSVFGALAICQAIQDFQRLGHTMEIRVDGFAGSAASFIAATGKPVKMSRPALMMVHRPMSAISGNRSELEKMIETLDKVGEQIVGIYMRKTGLPRATVQLWMEQEQWFTSDEALAVGLIDEIVDERSPLEETIKPNTFGAPEAVLKRARQHVDELRQHVVGESLKVGRAETYDRAYQHYEIACRAAGKLVEQPGCTNFNMLEVEGALRRAKEKLDNYRPDWDY
jgi:ATP-dependent protease ClpP protease subunit